VSRQIPIRGAADWLKSELQIRGKAVTTIAASDVEHCLMLGRIKAPGDLTTWLVNHRDQIEERMQIAMISVILDVAEEAGLPKIASETGAANDGAR